MSEVSPGSGWERREARHGAVAAGNADGVAAGIEMLEGGGNAFDALVATAFAMGVVEPLDCGLGGGGFAVLHAAADGETTSLDFMGTAPLAASYELYQSESPVDGYRIRVRERANEIGHRSVAVPGAVAGLAAIARRHGRLPLAESLAPAIRLAEEGFRMARKPVVRVTRTRATLAAFPEARRLFLLPGDEVPPVGAQRTSPDYARTLRALAEDGEAAFYEGEIGEAIAREMAAGGGFLTREDLQSYRPLWRRTARGRFAGRLVHTMAPPSSGYLVLRGLAALASTEGDLREEQRSRAALVMFRARADDLGDPAFSAGARRLARTAVESAETTSLSAVDAEGNAASLTYSLNQHSGVVVPGTGMLLNNQMLLFNPWPGTPNSVVAGARPASSMMPTIVLGPHGVETALGASGSTRILSAILQIMDRVFRDGEDLAAAIGAARVHAEGDRMLADEDLADLATPLAARLGLELSLMPGRDSAMGAVQAVGRAGRTLVAVGDPRAGAVGRVS